jgi:hypothetical protein
MSAHGVISLILQFGQFKMNALNLVVTIMKHMLDNQNKKK